MNFLMVIFSMKKIAPWICKFLSLNPTMMKSWDNIVFLKDKDSAERRSAIVIVVTITIARIKMSSFPKAFISLLKSAEKSQW